MNGGRSSGKCPQCQQPARKTRNAIYCSDQCRREHANAANFFQSHRVPGPQPIPRNAVLARLLKGPAAKSELPKVSDLTCFVKLLNEELASGGRRIVVRIERRKSPRLGLYIEERVYELVKAV